MMVEKYISLPFQIQVHINKTDFKKFVITFSKKLFTVSKMNRTISTKMFDDRRCEKLDISL